MIAIGNFFLAVATLVFLWLCKTALYTRVLGTFSIRPVGLFFICLAVMTAIILKQGGLDWVGSSTGQRTKYAVLGFLVLFAGNRYLSINHELPFVSIFPVVFSILVPILLLISAGVLLNWNYANLSPHLYKTPIYASVIASAAGIGLVLLLKIFFVVAYYLGGDFSQNSDTQRKLGEIEALDKMATIDLLSYAHPYHVNSVRKKALRKLKSRPDWQEELVRGLQSERAPNVFSFLAYNDVKHTTLFPQAINQGILMSAKALREDIRQCPDANSLKQAWYSEVVEDMLLTVEKFKEMGVDYRPAMQALGDALDEPTSFEKPEIQAKSMVDEWLKKH